VLDERFGLDSRSLSVVTVLVLRGPQTVGELRARTERMADFDSLDSVDAELGRLSSGADPLVRRLLRRPGQKEERWAHLLGGEPVEPEVSADAGMGADDVGIPRRSVSRSDEIASLRADLDTIQKEIVRLSDVVEKLRVALDL
jgi:uncharacterized protein YceH (UPF0502 family)